MNNSYRDYSDYLMHYGILGMRWGIRRYQNPDGTLTELGKKQYSKEKEEEKDLVDSHYKKYYRNEGKYMARTIAKANDAAVKGNSKNVQKYMSKFARSSYRAKVYKDLAEAEIKKIENTPVSELSAERRSKETKALVTSLLTSAAVNAVMMPTMGVGGMVISRPDRSYLSDEEKQQIINESSGGKLTRSDMMEIMQNSRRYGALKPRRKN